jgi:hypothetical protein
MTRAKFVCTSIAKSKHWDGSKGFLYTAEMMPVTSGSDENKSFFEATPSGSLKLGQFRDDLFEVGAQYYIDFTKAE